MVPRAMIFIELIISWQECPGKNSKLIIRFIIIRFIIHYENTLSNSLSDASEELESKLSLIRFSALFLVILYVDSSRIVWV